MTHWSQTLMPIWKATNLQLLPLMMLTHLKALWKQTELAIHIVCFYCSKRSWKKSNCYVYFLPILLQRYFLRSWYPLCNCSISILSYYQQRRENSCFHIHIPITHFTSRNLSNNPQETGLEASQLAAFTTNCTNTEGHEAVRNAMSMLSAGLVKNRRAGILY